MSSAVLVFNQYYWDLLKKIKDLARDLKYSNDDRGARDLLREIKRSYLSFDKLSEEHMAWFRDNVAADLDTALDGSSADGDADAIASVTKIDKELFKGMTVAAIAKLFKNPRVFFYYVVLISIFATPDISVTDVVAVLKRKHPWTAEDMAGFPEDGLVRKRLQLLNTVMGSLGSTGGSGGASGSAGASGSGKPDMMSELESTSLGKLAKEIMSEINMDEMASAIGEDGDILKALANPDGGFTKLLGTVSQKMISKLASGELQQDALMKDAMKLASNIPGGIPGAGGLGGMAGMMQQMSSMFGGGGDGDGPDIASMMSKFGDMMGGGKAAKGNAGAAAANMSRSIRAKQLKRKLEKRRQAKENID